MSMPKGIAMPRSRKIQYDLHKSVEAARASEIDVKALRAMSMEERGRLLSAACRLGAAIERSKKQMGLRSSEPAPWPPSTWEFLRKHAPNGRRP